MIEYFFKTTKNESFIPIPSAKDGCWVHLEEALAADLDQVGQLIGLEYSDLQDSVDRYEIPRIEHIKNNVLIFSRCPIELDNAVGLYTETLTMIVTPCYFITISPQKNGILRGFLNKPNTFATIQRSKLVIHLCMRVIQEFTTQIRKVRYYVLMQEKEIISVDSEDITILTRQEEILNQYLSSLEPMELVLKELPSGKYIPLQDKDQALLEDVFLSLKQSETICEIALKSIRSLRDSYQIIFTNNLHKTIKLLTALTIIFNIPTIVSSVYGMNVALPFAESMHAFAIILSLIFGFSLLFLWFFKRKMWL
ncbi:magnesium transporter CorA family protein [Candidatus Rhabdochlamydia porcellionis]|jgi:magnesium transporter|uniref:Cobalt/magnesium transport protein CorA n=1 Tax=Candidatus Rhabdochlamydia porcellionis TaxID=225148 RepID=A0ABX8YZU5_9BACT|nr:magnesium transporter CorA family protein [Candidatus Rhabdochlamydia porcellionis]QZA58930.1 Cobalt/magnesium transport protein CorA [Candidatus Rhabdochlamydia porcellionis]